MARSRREFLRITGSVTGAALLGGCSAGSAQSVSNPDSSKAGAGGEAGASSASPAKPSAPAPASSTAAAALSPAMASLKTYLQYHASSTFSLPPAPLAVPTITWAGALTGSTPATSLPSGLVVPFSSSLISKPLPQSYTASLPGNPVIQGVPCLAVNRPYSCKGVPQTVPSVRSLRFSTDAAVIELTGVVPDGSQTIQTLIVDGQLIPPTVLTSSVGHGGGWTVGTIRIAFGTSQLRDIWVQLYMFVAYVKVGASDSIVAVDDSAEPQLTVVGDSYQQAPSSTFANGGAIALEVATRLGIRKVATDAIGGTGYWNSGRSLGNFNDRLPAHAQDNSAIYLVIGGLNDYGDAISPTVTNWPTSAVFQQAVLGYLQGLRARQPNALIVMTAPFCPIPSLSDSSYVGQPATNTSGMGDNLWKAAVFKESIQQIAAPWIYIDVLMGTGWLNSSGASGDVRNLQWLTGGVPAAGTTATYKPGNTNGGGGGGFGGIAGISVNYGGHYSQAPDISTSGGSGSGLLLASRMNLNGAMTGIVVVSPGRGYSSAGLPKISIDPTYQFAAASLAAPTLLVGINPDGAYPLPSWEPEGVTDLNNIYRMLNTDKTHPSPVGIEYLSTRLALNIFEAVMAL